MKKILIVCLLALLAVPGLAQERLAAPSVSEMYATDYSAYSSEVGWCLTLRWNSVPGASSYAVKVWGSKNSWGPYNTAGNREKPQWKPTTDYGYTSNGFAVPICYLGEDQQVKVRLRAVDESGQAGIATQKFSAKIPEYADAPVSSRNGVPTKVYFGFSMD